MRLLSDNLITTQTIGGDTYSEVYDLRHIIHAQVLARISTNNPDNLVFESADVNLNPENTIDSVTSIQTATAIQELTTTGTLPANLNLSQTYNLINHGDGTISIAGNRSKALDDDRKILVNQGTGTHTIVWDTAIGGTLRLQKTLGDPNSDNSVWVDLDDDEILNGNNLVGFSADGDISWILRDISFTGLRIFSSVTSGTIDLDTYISGKGA